MDNYNGLAGVYDYLVAGVDFEGWADYVEEILQRLGQHPVSVLDLACGTGNTLLPMARRGYQAKGVDISQPMIERACSKAIGACLDIDYFVGDMREFLLDVPVDLVTCFHDGLNYITNEEDLKKIFVNTSKNLTDGGIFIFDLNTIDWVPDSEQYPVVIHEEGMTLIYTTRYDAPSSLWTVDLVCFIKEGNVYYKFSETHVNGAMKLQKLLICFANQVLRF